MSQFEALKRRQASSFAAQKKLIKTLLSGKQVLCEQCNQPLTWSRSDDGQLHIRCPKGCTDLLLELG